MSNLNPSHKGQGVALSKSSEVAIQPNNSQILSLEATEVKTVDHVLTRLQDAMHLKDMYEKAGTRVTELEEFVRIIQDESGLVLTAHHRQEDVEIEFTNLKSNSDFIKAQLEFGRMYLKEIKDRIQNFNI